MNDAENATVETMPSIPGVVPRTETK
jgi:hypothetical protein